MMPRKSVSMGLPKHNENAKSTHGKYGALKLYKPNKLMRTFAFSLPRPHTYTIMNESECPRNLILEKKLTQHARVTINRIPNINMNMKSAALPLNLPSSNSLQYRNCETHEN